MRKILILSIFAVCTAVVCQAQTTAAEPLSPTVAGQVKTGPDENQRRLLAEANQALAGRDYERAIQSCDEGLRLAPNEPAFLITKAAALLGRGQVTYNAAIFQTDEVLKQERKELAQRDFLDAAEAAGRGLMEMRIGPEASSTLAAAFAAQRLGALRLRADALFIVATKVDPVYTATCLEALHEYVAAEARPERKLEGQVRAAQLLLIAERFMDAFAEYQNILLADPDNLDANVGAAVVLLDFGQLTNDGAYRQQGIDYLEKFVARAPAQHPLRSSAEEALTFLKQQPVPAQAPGYNAAAPGDKGLPPVQSSSSGQAKRASGVTTIIGTSPPVVGAAPGPGAGALNGGVLNGKAVHLAQPPYPAIAKFGRASGTVVVQVTIDEAGNVIAAHANSGHPLLMAVAVAAAERSKFTPTRLSGQPVKVAGIIQYNFVAQ